MLSIMEQKDALYTLLEEDRQRCAYSPDRHPSPTSSTSTTSILHAQEQYFSSSTPCLSIPNDSAQDQIDNTSSSSSTLLHPNDSYSQNNNLRKSSVNTFLSVSPSTSRRSSVFDSLELMSRRPSVFDKDPCTVFCNHLEESEQAQRKINKLFCYESGRRMTLADLTPSRISLTSSNQYDPHPSISLSKPSTRSITRRYSLNLSFDKSYVVLPDKRRKSSNLSQLKNKPFKPLVRGRALAKPVPAYLKLDKNKSSSLLSSACCYALVVVVAVWIVPYIISYLLFFISYSSQNSDVPF